MSPGEEVLQKIVTEFLSPLYALVASCAFIYFLYGVAKFVYSMNNPDEKNTGKEHMMYGMIGLFIIFSVGGILHFFSNIFGSMFQF